MVDATRSDLGIRAARRRWPAAGLWRWKARFADLQSAV